MQADIAFFLRSYMGIASYQAFPFPTSNLYFAGYMPSYPSKANGPGPTKLFSYPHLMIKKVCEPRKKRLVIVNGCRVHAAL